MISNLFRSEAASEAARADGAVRAAGAARWLMPDLALLIALAVFFYIFTFYQGSTALFRDSDTGWHIRNGERILATGLLPRSDPYSFSKPGAPWVAWEWGADVLMGAVHHAAGLGGVALLYGVAIAAAIWLWFRLNWAAEGNFLFAILLTGPVILTTTLHWLARPHVFSWLFLLAAVWFCERPPARIGWGSLGLAAAFTALWANVHASFFFAPLIALVYAAGAYVRPWIWDAPGDAARARGFVWLAVAAGLGSMANPGGWGLHRHVISYLFDSTLLEQVSEFQSFNFNQAGGMQVIAALSICFAGAFAALMARRPERFLLTMLLLAVALRSVRGLPVAVLVLLPLANGSITEVLGAARGLNSRLRRRLDGVLRYGDRMRSLDRGLHGGALLIPLLAIAVYAAPRMRAGFPAEKFPVVAAAKVAALPADARIFAPDIFGGYLIYRFAGARKVFFDGRSDFYGDDLVKSYVRMMRMKPGWRKEFDGWRFTHALLAADHPLAAMLEAQGWREIYRDKTAVLLAGGVRKD